MSQSELQAPNPDFVTLSAWGIEHLARVVAIDSQSDENSSSIPSTQGQRILAEDLKEFFGAYGYATEQDDCANLVVSIPATVDGAPPLALMVHIDTAEGTQPLDKLHLAPGWKGDPIAYPGNSRLNVSADAYPATREFLGEDLIHGTGVAPFGLDDKLGMAQLMTLARVLAEPGYRHGEILLVFRPDEEIGRMEALESLAVRLADAGVRHGYTIDGIAPFEINVANFNAAGARLFFPYEPVTVGTYRATLRLNGVKSHGATAKAEGYLNAITVAANCVAAWPSTVVPTHFSTDSLAETNADLELAATTEGELDAAIKSLADALQPHVERGAHLEVVSRIQGKTVACGSVRRALLLVEHFISAEGPMPRLSEHSEGWEGYSNPYSLVSVNNEGSALRFRLRDFDPSTLDERCEHVARIAAAFELSEHLKVESQYTNMGPKLAAFPELSQWAVSALEPLGIEPRLEPIRGGTGVDPFVERGIGVANLGTGYFAPESEKEFTSVQSLARHTQWLTYLVQVVGAEQR
jgi:tripeptide aminopeptidase